MKKLIVMAFCLALFGCNTVLKDANDIANIADANDQVMSGRVAEVIKSANLSDTEKLTVDHALNKYTYFVDKWKKSIVNLDSKSKDFSDFLVDYNDLVAQYKAVKEQVIERHLTEYTAENRDLLAKYHNQANKINASVNGLIVAGNAYQAALDAIALGRVLAGIAKAL